MPRRRMNARTIREILRLKSLNLSTRQISRSVKKAKSSIQRLVRRAEQVGLRWPLDVDDRKLEEMLYAEARGVVCEGKPLPDWSYIHGQLKRKGVTRQLLWKEYADAHPDNHYSYTRFCELYSAWRAKNSEPSMRQLHKAGEKCFVDYAGADGGHNGPRNRGSDQGADIRRGHGGVELHLRRGHGVPIS